MGCASLETILKSCDNNSGGIYKFYVNQQDNIQSISTDETGTNWIVDGITFVPTADPFIELEFRRNVSSYTEDSNIDLINGSSYVTATINLMFHRRDQEKSRAIKRGWTTTDVMRAHIERGCAGSVHSCVLALPTGPPAPCLCAPLCPAQSTNFTQS